MDTTLNFTAQMCLCRALLYPTALIYQLLYQLSALLAF